MSAGDKGYSSSSEGYLDKLSREDPLDNAFVRNQQANGDVASIGDLYEQEVRKRQMVWQEYGDTYQSMPRQKCLLLLMDEGFSYYRHREWSDAEKDYSYYLLRHPSGIVCALYCFGDTLSSLTIYFNWMPHDVEETSPQDSLFTQGIFSLQELDETIQTEVQPQPTRNALQQATLLQHPRVSAYWETNGDDRILVGSWRGCDGMKFWLHQAQQNGDFLVHWVKAPQMAIEAELQALYAI